MATYIETLKKQNGDQIAPRTVAQAVSMNDGSNVQDILEHLSANKVDAVDGKGLSTNDYTTAEKNKLSTVEEGAQVNVQADWEQGDETKADYIKNKPDNLVLAQPMYKHTVQYSTQWDDYGAPYAASCTFITTTDSPDPIVTGAQFKDATANITSYTWSGGYYEHIERIDFGDDWMIVYGYEWYISEDEHGDLIEHPYYYESEEPNEYSTHRQVSYSDTVEEIRDDFRLVSSDGVEILPKTTADKVDVNGQSLTEVLENVQDELNVAVYASKVYDHKLYFNDLDTSGVDAYAFISWNDVTAMFKTHVENPSMSNVNDWIDDFNRTAYDFTGYRQIDYYTGSTITDYVQPFKLSYDNVSSRLFANSILQEGDSYEIGYCDKYSEVFTTVSYQSALKDGTSISLKTDADDVYLNDGSNVEEFKDRIEDKIDSIAGRTTLTDNSDAISKKIPVSTVTQARIDRIYGRYYREPVDINGLKSFCSSTYSRTCKAGATSITVSYSQTRQNGFGDQSTEDVYIRYSIYTISGKTPKFTSGYRDCAGYLTWTWDYDDIEQGYTYMYGSFSDTVTFEALTEDCELFVAIVADTAYNPDGSFIWDAYQPEGLCKVKQIRTAIDSSNIIDTYIIPSEIQSLSGYGDDGTYLDLNEKVFVSADGTSTDVSGYITRSNILNATGAKYVGLNTTLTNIAPVTYITYPDTPRTIDFAIESASQNTMEGTIMPRISRLDREGIEAGWYDEAALEKFSQSFNRVYVEMSRNRGIYGKVALTASGKFASQPVDFDVKDQEIPYYLGSIPTRLPGSEQDPDFGGADTRYRVGHVKVPAVDVDNFPTAEEAKEFAVSKTYVDTAIDKNNNTPHIYYSLDPDEKCLVCTKNSTGGSELYINKDYQINSTADNYFKFESNFRWTSTNNTGELYFCIRDKSGLKGYIYLQPSSDKIMTNGKLSLNDPLSTILPQNEWAKVSIFGKLGGMSYLSVNGTVYELNTSAFPVPSADTPIYFTISLSSSFQGIASVSEVGYMLGTDENIATKAYKLQPISLNDYTLGSALDTSQSAVLSSSGTTKWIITERDDLDNVVVSRGELGNVAENITANIPTTVKAITAQERQEPKVYLVDTPTKDTYYELSAVNGTISTLSMYAGGDPGGRGNVDAGYFKFETDFYWEDTAGTGDVYFRMFNYANPSEMMLVVLQPAGTAYIKGSPNTYFNLFDAIPLNTWTHLEFIVYPSSIAIYANNKLVAKSSMILNPLDQQNSIKVQVVSSTANKSLLRLEKCLLTVCDECPDIPGGSEWKPLVFTYDPSIDTYFSTSDPDSAVYPGHYLQTNSGSHAWHIGNTSSDLINSYATNRLYVSNQLNIQSEQLQKNIDSSIQSIDDKYESLLFTKKEMNNTQDRLYLPRDSASTTIRLKELRNSVINRWSAIPDGATTFTIQGNDVITLTQTSEVSFNGYMQVAVGVIGDAQPIIDKLEVTSRYLSGAAYVSSYDDVTRFNKFGEARIEWQCEGIYDSGQVIISSTITLGANSEFIGKEAFAILTPVPGYVPDLDLYFNNHEVASSSISSLWIYNAAGSKVSSISVPALKYYGMEGDGVFNYKTGYYYSKNSGMSGYIDKNTYSDTVSIPEGGYIIAEDSLNQIQPPVLAKYEYQSYNSDFYNLQPLSGKKIAYHGDSICESRTDSSKKNYNGGGYAKIIADMTGCTYDNKASSGSVFVSELPEGASLSSTGKYICTDIDNMPDDADIICFEAVINDWYKGCPIGSLSAESDYSGSLDTTTVLGAIETICRKAINKWPGKPICFVIPHKVANMTYTQCGGTDPWSYKELHDAMIQIFNKYSIPYLDIFNEGGLNAYIDVHNNLYLTGGSSGQPDRTHPNEEGYKKYYVPRLIKLFESLI